MTSAVLVALGDSRPFFEGLFGLTPGSLTCHHHNPAEAEGSFAERLLDFTMRCWQPDIDRLDFELPPAPRPFGIVLAAESEWGHSGNRKVNFRKVVDDFLKLLDVQAPVKAMVYGCYLGDEPGNAESQRDRFEYVLRTLGGHTPGEVWLFAGFPWRGDDTWAAQVHVCRIGPDGLRVVRPEWI
jgi:hypothetical protein